MNNPHITLDRLKQALENDEFSYFYQPKVLMFSGEIYGAEALIRWQKPDDSIIMPHEFIPLAEETGFITEITIHMFQKLIIDMTIIHDIMDSITISFNASSKDFEDNRFIDTISNAIDENLINPDRLEIELTETVKPDQKNLIDALITIQNKGISIAMDDFGTGYATIDALGKLPFNTIKLDQGSVSRIDETEKGFTLAQTSIWMAHQLNLSIVAEGIESEATYQTLQNEGCEIAQGFWISHPLSLADFLDFTRHKKHTPAVPIAMLHMAQLDHLTWRKAIIDGVFYLLSREDNDDLDRLRGMPELDATECNLGVWYYGKGKIFKSAKWYKALEKPHNKLHKLGKKLIKAASTKSSSKDKIISMMRELSSLSTQIIRILQSIENEIVSDKVNSSNYQLMTQLEKHKAR